VIGGWWPPHLFAMRHTLHFAPRTAPLACLLAGACSSSATEPGAGTGGSGGGGTPFTTPSYTYMLDAGSGVQSAVQAGAGPH
jgi:hypothetical protein